MDLKKWEIWHTYSTYLQSGVLNLELAAEAMVRAGVAQCVLHRDGGTFWRHEDEAYSGITEISMSEDSKSANVRLRFEHENVPIEDSLR
jgi:hypothetical protein